MKFKKLFLFLSLGIFSSATFTTQPPVSTPNSNPFSFYDYFTFYLEKGAKWALDRPITINPYEPIRILRANPVASCFTCVSATVILGYFISTKGYAFIQAAKSIASNTFTHCDGCKTKSCEGRQHCPNCTCQGKKKKEEKK